MQIFTGLFGFVTPILLATWIGTRLRRPLGAFFLGWVATPIAAIPVALILMVLMDTPLATIVAVELPIACIFLGLLSGGLAAFIVHRRLVASRLPDTPLSGEAKVRNEEAG